jgi:hypothetical protein
MTKLYCDSFRCFLIVSAVLAATNLQAKAEEPLLLDCTPETIIPAPNNGQIVRISVQKHDLDWQITHVAANGARYERTEQYGVHDTSDQTGPSWGGTLVGRPFLKMIGRVFSAGDHVTYVESLFDARKGGEEVMTTRSNCIAFETQSQAPRVESAPPPPPQAAPSIGAVGCLAVSVSAERLACYDKAAGYEPQETEAPSKQQPPSPPSLPPQSAGVSAPEPTTASDEPDILDGEAVNVSKSRIVEYTGGGGWRIDVQSKSESLTIKDVIVNRGNCVPDGDTRRPPITIKFGQSWIGYLPCNPIEVVIKTSLGTGTFTWSQ